MRLKVLIHGIIVACCFVGVAQGACLGNFGLGWAGFPPAPVVITIGWTDQYWDASWPPPIWWDFTADDIGRTFNPSSATTDGFAHIANILTNDTEDWLYLPIWYDHGLALWGCFPDSGVKIGGVSYFGADLVGYGIDSITGTVHEAWVEFNIYGEPATPVPVPGTVLLGVIGLSGVGWLRGRRTI